MKDRVQEEKNDKRTKECNEEMKQERMTRKWVSTMSPWCSGQLAWLRNRAPGIDAQPGQSVAGSPSCSSFLFGMVDKWVCGEEKLWQLGCHIGPGAAGIVTAPKTTATGRSATAALSIYFTLLY